ncbi:MAG: hypothetical protein QM784_36650 [Polyangiaceae bacterium]
MNFPRYVRTDSRDFMYVTHRAILSKERLETDGMLAQPKGLRWQTQGLPQHGYPPAIALGQTQSSPSDSPRLSVVLVDAKSIEPCRSNCQVASHVFATPTPTGASELRAYFHRRRFVIAAAPPDPSAVVVAAGQPKNRIKAARAAVGITDGQWLYYVEPASGGNPAHDAAAFDRALDEFGCRTRVFSERPLGLSVGEGDPGGVDTERIHWLRTETPLARRILEDTPIVPYQVWAPLQAKRVRYKRQPSATRPAATAMPELVPARDADTPAMPPAEAPIENDAAPKD